ncbi:MAG: hypothetical protein QNJ45_00700 [Ardenticatenaceae bacterium]|nr:hypothetical protein [Ardenticatenaceae bacterium]
MGSTDNTEAIVFDEEKNSIAKIILNGYNIAAGGPLGKNGAMRSFKMVEGNLFTEWSLGKRLEVKSEDGRTATIRIAAHPAEQGATGFVEFLS